ncbi:M20 metallopeptidase family protein [Clostridium sp. DL1XJH146]
MYKDIIMKKALAINEKLVEIRRDIHAHPEVGLQEIRTSSLVEKELRKLGLEVTTNVGVTGVIGVLRGSHPGKTLLIRADMDCLEMMELNDVAYKSKYPGKMHACGHDAHTTWLLGTAMILAEMKEYIHGNIKFCFQPAEEVEGGAERMINAGILDNPKVDAAIGAHVWSKIEAGKIGVKSGALMASPDMFHITISGKGGHAAHPDLTIDPIAIANEVFSALQTIVSRNVDPLEPAVLSITQFNAGSAHNIIPEKVELAGTVRTFSPDLRKWMPKQMENIIKGIVEAHDGKYNFDYSFEYPSLINDAKITELIKKSASKIIGEENIIDIQNPSMGGEDFAYFAQKVPSSFFLVGNYNKEKNITATQHNPHFNVDEDILHNASAVMSNIALDYLSE